MSCNDPRTQRRDGKQGVTYGGHHGPTGDTAGGASQGGILGLLPLPITLGANGNR